MRIIDGHGRVIDMEVLIPGSQSARLEATCFRGRDRALAGNFFAWANQFEFASDPETIDLLSRAIQRLFDEKRVDGNQRIELEYSRDVGWDSVVELDDLNDDLRHRCELRQINNNAEALFLPVGLVLAPRINVATLAVRLRHRDGRWQCLIETIYPGADCGRLHGNMTDRLGLVWLAWNNEGE